MVKKLGTNKKGDNIKQQKNFNLKEKFGLNYKYNKIQFGYFKLILIIIIFIKESSNESEKTIINSFITLIINNKGKNKIFCSDDDFNTNYYPDEIYINGEKTKCVNNTYSLKKDNNIIELKWNRYIKNSKSMFNGCSNITEIDLSNFDSSQITQTSNMFTKCSKLNKFF